MFSKSHISLLLTFLIYPIAGKIGRQVLKECLLGSRLTQPKNCNNIQPIKLTVNPYWMNDFGIGQGIRRKAFSKGSPKNDIRVVRSPDTGAKEQDSFRDALQKFNTDDAWIAPEWMLQKCPSHQHETLFQNKIYNLNSILSLASFCIFIRHNNFSLFYVMYNFGHSVFRLWSVQRPVRNDLE